MSKVTIVLDVGYALGRNPAPGTISYNKSHFSVNSW